MTSFVALHLLLVSHDLLNSWESLLESFTLFYFPNFEIKMKGYLYIYGERVGLWYTPWQPLSRFKQKIESENWAGALQCIGLFIR